MLRCRGLDETTDQGDEPDRRKLQQNSPNYESGSAAAQETTEWTQGREHKARDARHRRQNIENNGWHWALEYKNHCLTHWVVVFCWGQATKTTLKAHPFTKYFATVRASVRHRWCHRRREKHKNKNDAHMNGRLTVYFPG